MKQLGAVLLQDAVWILPECARTREQFQWLAVEITELGGEAMLWVSDLLYASDEESLRHQFEGPVENAYRDILNDLKKKAPDLAELSKRYQRVKDQDFFHCPLGARVRDKLLSATGGSRKSRGARTP
jgi:hypothetical protein